MHSTLHPLAAGLTAGLLLTALTPTQQRFWVRSDRAPAGPVIFDHDRGRAIAFRAGNMFEWNGSGWDRRDSSLGPLPVAQHAMGYHAATGRTVLIGGYDGRAYMHWTNVWDGAEWTIPSGSGPGQRTGSAMAYDDLRQRLVLFGGSYLSTYDDTWEWDGTQWTRSPSSTTPPRRRQHAMTYDSVRNVTVMFGGNGINGLDDTWEWDGTDWTQRVVAGPPSASRLDLVFDTARGVSVLIADDETWEWDGSSWTLVTTVPPETGFGRYPFYDSVRRAVVALGDDARQWAWNGTAWVELVPPRRPTSVPGRGARRLVYDSARQRTVTYDLTETSEWDGTVWHVQSVSPAPLLSGHALAYDPVRAETVLFGGGRNGQVENETWVWDGTSWTQRQPATAPPPRAGAAMAWDPVNQRVLLFGGNDPSPLLDTWAWDGTNWTQLQPTNAPPASSAWMTTDPVRNRIILPVRNVGTWEWDGQDWSAAGGLPRFGIGPIAYHEGLGRTVTYDVIGGYAAEWDGSSWTTTVQIPLGSRTSYYGGMTYHAALDAIVLLGDETKETWLYGDRAPAEANVGPAGCSTGTQPRLVGAGTPWLGHAAFALDLLGGAAQRPGGLLVGAAARSTPFGACTLQLDLGQLLASAPITTSRLGFASVALPVPLDPTLAGLRLFAQGVSIDATQPDPVRLSNLLELVVGH